MKPEMRDARASLADPDVIYLEGTWNPEDKLHVQFEKEELEFEIEEKEADSAEERLSQQQNRLVWVQIKIYLPKDHKFYGNLKLFAVNGSQCDLWAVLSSARLRTLCQYPQYFIEDIDNKGHSIMINGWVAAREDVQIEVVSVTGEKLKYVVKRFQRSDVHHRYFECDDICADAGFSMIIDKPECSKFFIRFISGENISERSVITSETKYQRTRYFRYLSKAINYVKENGVSSLPDKIRSKMRDRNLSVNYQKWLRYHIPDEFQLKDQRKEKFDLCPRISIVVPLYKTPQSFLKKAVASVRNQSYTNWELILCDGSKAPSPLRRTLGDYMKADKRIKVIPATNEAVRIVPNTNRGIEIATGSYIAFMDHDDELAPNALYECVKAINKNNEPDLIYSDEDKMDTRSLFFFEPQFKPDFNIDLLRSVNYICHLCVIKTDFLRQVGLLDAHYEGAQDYDLVLRCVENTKNIVHIPKILYHWRSHEDSTSENPESKRYAFEAGKKAIAAHYKRVGITAEVLHGEYPGLYRTRYIRDYDPLISILIPNKDHVEDLSRCIDTIEEKSTYRNYEYIIIENNSEEEETFAYYEKLKAENPKVKVVVYEDVFNYSKINNFGEKAASGEYLLLLNNDTEIINPDCLEELLGYCMREDVGAVGARLYYEDGCIQHAGVVIGFGGIAGHCFVQQPGNSTGYCHRIITAEDYSAVTAACVMVDRKAFQKVEGFYEGLAVAFNDIDFCMKLRKEGYLIVYNPYAELYHYESKSRGLEDTPEKIARFNSEIETFRERWPEILRDGDPYYNPNLSLKTQDFSIERNY